MWLQKSGATKDLADPLGDRGNRGLPGSEVNSRFGRALLVMSHGRFDGKIWSASSLKGSGVRRWDGGGLRPQVLRDSHACQRRNAQAPPIPGTFNNSYRQAVPPWPSSHTRRHS